MNRHAINYYLDRIRRQGQLDVRQQSQPVKDDLAELERKGLVVQTGKGVYVLAKTRLRHPVAPGDKEAS
jgi:hypothetical protein